MKKDKSFKFFLSFLTLCIGISLGFITVNVSEADEPVAGSDGDPLITESYLELRLGELNKTLLYKIEEVKKMLVDNNALPSEEDKQSETQISEKENIVIPTYKILELKKGDVIYFGENVEVIVRSGKVIAIEGEKGGIADLTDGYDLKNGDEVKLNHLLLIARDDGRGFNIQSTAFIMVKGIYKLNENE